jgi:hypothetical protein
MGDRTGSLFGLFPDGRRPGHFRLNGPCRNRHSVADTQPRRYLKY